MINYNIAIYTTSTNQYTCEQSSIAISTIDLFSASLKTAEEDTKVESK